VLDFLFQLFISKLDTIASKAAEMTLNLTHQQKIEWAAAQRKQGNVLFGTGDYKEAMDVYLTCLVAMDVSNSPSTNTEMKCNEDDISAADDITSSASFKSKSEVEIQLPVLLNLALCALKLGMLSKAEKFCNYALELEAGLRSAKAHFRRGRIRMLLGNYVDAELDLDKALNLIQQSCVDDAGSDGDSTNSLQKDDTQVILREKQKLHRLVQKAEMNHNIQKRAMERLFNSAEHDGDAKAKSVKSTVGKSLKEMSSGECSSLYPKEKTGRRNFSTLRDDPSWDHSLFINDQSNEAAEASHFISTHVAWYLQMIGRCAQRLLDIIGYDNEDHDRITQRGIVHNSDMSVLSKKKDL
jgi:tetratricopeptide (TPR) repeat protein